MELPDREAPENQCVRKKFAVLDQSSCDEIGDGRGHQVAPTFFLYAPEFEA